MGFNLQSVGFVGALRPTAPPATAPLVWQEDNAGITWTGSWARGVRAAFFGVAYLETITIGSAYQFTVPAGYTAVSLQGHKDTGGSYFHVQKNGVAVLNADQYAASDITEQYLTGLPLTRLAVVPGDVIRFAMTNSTFAETAGTINVACYADQITFHP